MLRLPRPIRRLGSMRDVPVLLLVLGKRMERGRKVLQVLCT